MDKNDFFTRLRAGLTGNVAPAEVERLVNYYEEMIADLVEDGVSEEEAVSRMGDPNEIVFDAVDNAHAHDESEQNAQTAQAESVWTPPAMHYTPRREVNWLMVVLLILTCPIWGSIAFAALCVVASIDLSIWCLPFAGACVAGGFGVGGLMLLFTSLVALMATPFIGVTQLGLGLGCLGVALLSGWITYKFSAVFLKEHMALVHWVFGKLNERKAAWF